MRELNVCPSKRNKFGAVHRLQFFTGGSELVAWVEASENDDDYGPGCTQKLCAYDLVADKARALVGDDWFNTWGEVMSEVVVSPDLRFLAGELNFDDDADGILAFENLRTDDKALSHLPVSQPGLGALAFTPDGTELIGVRNYGFHDAPAPDVARFEMIALDQPPEVREGINPFTNQPYRTLVRDLRWKAGVRLPPGEMACACGLSANGRLLAVGTERTTIHIADLKRKKVTASFPWEGRKLRYTAVVRIAFDPAAKWVVMLASGRLFARPLGKGEAWHTKEKLGAVRDFSFHPSGRVICAVFEDGEARYLDPLTGAVRESFRWSKKPLHSVCFAPDGLTCAAGSVKGSVVLWDVDV